MKNVFCDKDEERIAVVGRYLGITSRLLLLLYCLLVDIRPPMGSLRQGPLCEAFGLLTLYGSSQHKMFLCECTTD